MEPSELEKALKEAQGRILGLEETIAGLKKKPDDAKAVERITALEKELSDTRKDRDDIKSKIWDQKTERRAADRRTPKKVEAEPKNLEHSFIGGPYGE